MADIYNEFLDLEEVANYLKVGIETIYRYLKDEKNPLPSFKISSRKILVKKDELDKWLDTYRKGQEW